MAELGTGKSVVVLAIVVGCFSILWPKIFYPMMQTALSLTAPKYDADDVPRCQFMLDVDTTSYAFFANLCDQLVARESSALPPRLPGRSEKAEDEEEKVDLPQGLMGRCQTALSVVCRLDLQPSLQARSLEEVEVCGRDRREKLDLCLSDLVKTLNRKRRRFQKRKIVNTWELQSRTPPHLHLPPRMREAMGEARPDLPPFHPSSHHQGSQHRPHAGPPHLMKDGRPFPHPSSRQPPKPQPKTGGAMSIVMPLYTIGIIGFFLYTLLKLLFKKRNEEQSDQQPVIPDYHMDPSYHRYILGNDRPSNHLKQQQQPQQQTTVATAGGPSKIFVNESKTKRLLEEFGKQKVIGSLKTLISQMQNYDQPLEENGEADARDSPPQEGSKVEDLQVTCEKTENLDEEMNQKEASSNSSPDTESYELISGPQEDSGRSESEGSEDASPVPTTTITTNNSTSTSPSNIATSSPTTTLRQRFVHDASQANDDSRNRSYKLSDILQF